MRATLLEFIHHKLVTEVDEDLNLDIAGGVLVMPVTHPMITKTTTGAETLTLANGLPGQVLTICLTAHGGTGTLTPDTSTNWSNILLEEAGDQVVLLFVDNTIGWIILSVFGLTAQPTVTA